MAGAHGSTQESLAASGQSSEKLSLPALQSKMKRDPEGYESELQLLYNQFHSTVDLYKQQAALNFSSVSGIGSDRTVAKDLGDRASFLAHVTPFYPKHLAQFPRQLADFFRSSARTMPSGLRLHVAQALILLMNRKIIGIEEMLSTFLEVQTLGDRSVRKLAFSHVVQSIRKMNQKHRNEATNRALQNVVFSMLQQDDEAKAKRALVTLFELHRRKVWCDERATNAICMACFHSSSRIMISALSFLLDYEKIEDDDDSDASSSDDETVQKAYQVVIGKEIIYKAHNKGTTASKKKKQAKLQRAIRSMKRQQRASSEKTNATYSPLNHLYDPQGFAEKLFSRLRTCNERFEVKMMMLKVIARTVGLHWLILLNLYPFLQKYCQPHQRDITNILAAAVQSCHDMVPPDAVEPLFKQIVNQFVHDRSRPEAIAVGLNVIREICVRMPLLMTEELLQDLALYKKSHQKPVSAAARSLIALFREVCPSLLVKKDRGRFVNPKARPKEYGEVRVPSNVPGVELLQEGYDDESNADSEAGELSSDTDDDDGSLELAASGDEENQLAAGDVGSGEEDEDADQQESDDDNNGDERNSTDDDSDGDDEAESDTEDKEAESEEDEEEDHEEAMDTSEKDGGDRVKSNKKKRTISDFDENILSAETSLRALKRLAVAKMGHPSSDETDGILSNEDFQRIEELRVKKDAAQQGFKIPTSDQLRMKRVDPATLEAHIKQKLTKQQRLALVKAGREDRGKYQSRTAIKQKKTGGLSNKQKEHKKKMPLAAKRSKVAKSREVKKRKGSRTGKQFRGRKAWK